MKNMRVKQKLIVSFLVIAVITAIVGGVGIVGLYVLNTNEETLYRLSDNAAYASNLVTNLEEQRVAYRDAVLYIEDVSGRTSAINKLNELDESYDEIYAYLDTHLLTETGRAYLEEIDAAYKGSYRPLRNELVQAVSAGDANQAVQLLRDLAVPVNTVVDSAQSFITFNTQTSSSTSHSDAATANTLMSVLSVLVIVAVAAAVLLGIYIARLITTPLLRMKAMMDQVGNTGSLEFSEEVKADLIKKGQGKDEIGQSIAAAVKMVQHFDCINVALQLVAAGDLTAECEVLSDKDTIGLSVRKMLENLNTMFGEIRTASGQVSAGAGQVAQAAQGLASGSTEQAAGIEQFSASLTELQEKTNYNAENSTKAQEANNKTSNMLESSIRSMGEMLEAMKAIDESSANITKVIKVIDDIAFQTNILALNAAVEAARAGQHGKGFAVVADEVRNLASKSAAAAKETAALIEGSTERVREGNQIVAKTNADLEGAAENGRESSRLIEQVAAASTEQARAILEINQGIEQISTVVQSNSATAEQSAAAAQQMSAQAVVLDEIVSKFKFKQGVQDSMSFASDVGYNSRVDASGFSLSHGKY